MNFKLNTPNLLGTLQRAGLEPKQQPQSDQIFCIKKMENIELVLFFRILSEGELLQIMTGLPFPLRDELKNDVARLLHKLNLDLDMPGFGMDEKTKLIFYRSVFPCQNKVCEVTLLDKYLEVGPRVCSSFAQVLAVVAQGHMTYDELLRKSQ